MQGGCGGDGYDSEESSLAPLRCVGEGATHSFWRMALRVSHGYGTTGLLGWRSSIRPTPCCMRRFHAVTCRSPPAADDDVMGYHGVGGDDDDDVIVKQPARRAPV